MQFPESGSLRNQTIFSSPPGTVRVSLRLYDVGGSQLRLEAPSEAALLDCRFQDESVAFTAGSDGFIRRYDLHSGIYDSIGNHDDIPTCVGYWGETRFAVGSIDGSVALEISCPSSSAYPSLACYMTCLIYVPVSTEVN